MVEFLFHHGALGSINQLGARHSMLKVITQLGRKYVSRDHVSSPRFAGVSAHPSNGIQNDCAMNMSASATLDCRALLLDS
jgi:hypothetical protein